MSFAQLGFQHDQSLAVEPTNKDLCNRQGSLGTFKGAHLLSPNPASEMLDTLMNSFKNMVVWMQVRWLRARVGTDYVQSLLREALCSDIL
jgi:hypothetical protein